MKALFEGAADEGGLGAAVEAEEDSELVDDEDAVVFEFVGAVGWPRAAAQRGLRKAADEFVGVGRVVGGEDKLPVGAPHEDREPEGLVFGPGGSQDEDGALVAKGVPGGEWGFTPRDARGGGIKSPVAEHEGRKAGPKGGLEARGVLKADEGGLAQKPAVAEAKN